MAMQLVSLGRVKQPLLNEPFGNTRFYDNMRYVSQNLFKRVRQTNELVSMLDTAVTEHFLGPVDFFDGDGGSLGPTKRKKMKHFWEDENVQGSAFYGAGIDLFVDGSCFGWYSSADNFLTAKQKEAIARMKNIDASVGKFAEESSKQVRSISYLPASTVEIKHDEFGEIFYLQEASGRTVRWDPDQVVHIRLMDWNGEMRGFSPLKSLVREISMMYMLKDNILAKLENGGSPDYIISMKGANGVSRARFERLRTALESFSHLRKSHGNMPIDAEVNAIPLGTDLKDMEYRELAMFIISEFGLSLGLPTSRIPFLMTGSGGTSNKGELSGNSEDSYQKKINARRMIWENSWNKVFRKSNMTYKFRRDNLQDDVRETQASTQRASYVTEVQNSLAKSGKQLKTSAHLALLSGSKMNINEDDIEDIDLSKMPMQGPGMMSPQAGPGGKDQPSNMDSASRVSRDRSASKKNTSTNNGVYT